LYVSGYRKNSRSYKISIPKPYKLQTFLFLVSDSIPQSIYENKNLNRTYITAHVILQKGFKLWCMYKAAK